MKLFILSAIALKLASAVPLVPSSSDFVPPGRPETILSSHEKRALPPAYNPTIPSWVSNEDDGFIIDIPYPKHLIPQTAPERPVFKLMSLDTIRPKSRLSGSYESTTGSSTQNAMGSPADASESGSRKGHAKRDVTTQHHEKRGLMGFAVKNSPFIVGGAVVAGGGFWLWERYMRMKAEKMAKQKAINGLAKNGGDVDAKPGPAGPKAEKRAIVNEEEVEIVAVKPEQLDAIQQGKCPCARCECPGCWCTYSNCGKKDHRKKGKVEEEEEEQCACGADAEVNLLDS